MVREKRRSVSRKGAGNTGTRDATDTVVARPDKESVPAAFLRAHALSCVLFLLSLFFIITISNPALYTNDEWITANQLHQLDIGHQLTFSEGKYGVTQNGTVSAYFTYRQNVLMYSLALPVAALPVVRLFGLLGDNFRLIVILLWSLCLVLAALLLDTFYPARARIRGIRVLFPALFLAFLLFCGNILLYKQFPFSPPDAPFEVAALVLTNQVFFALTVAVVYETFLEILKKTWTALFGTFACLSSSSLIFWAGTAKDHMLTALVLSLIIFLYIRYLVHGKDRYAAGAFVLCGLIIWIRPEVGFFITIILGLSYCVPLLGSLAGNGAPAHRVPVALLPAAGVLIGAIPFFINNSMISRNWLIPAMDLPRDLVQPAGNGTVPVPLSQVTTDPSVISQTSGMTLPETLSRAYDMVMHAMFGGFTFENMVRGFIGTMTFPENQSIGFLIMCPLIVVGILALILWWKRVLDGPDLRRKILLFLFLMVCAVFLSYLTKFGSLNTSHGILPDMRYLSPAYIPCGLFSMVVLSGTPFPARPQKYLLCSIAASVLVVPALFFLMVFVHPFGIEYAGYSAMFRYTILAELVVIAGMMMVARWQEHGPEVVSRLLPYGLILLLLTVFSFQIMLTVLYGMIMKMNGYPFWIPLVREGVNLFVVIQYSPPV